MRRAALLLLALLLPVFACAEEGLDVRLRLDRATLRSGETVSGTILLTGGEQPVRGLALWDADDGRLIASGIALLPGEEQVVETVWPVRSQQSFCVSAEGEYTDGTRILACSNRVPVERSGVFDYAALSVTASCEEPVISRAGTVPVTIRIGNSGTADAREVLLFEPSLGEIRTFAFVPVGYPVVCTVPVQVSGETELVFRVTCAEEDGNLILEESEPLTLRVAPGGAEPSVPAEQSGIEALLNGTPLTLLILFPVLLTVLICMITLLIRGKRKRRRE